MAEAMMQTGRPITAASSTSRKDYAAEFSRIISSSGSVSELRERLCNPLVSENLRKALLPGIDQAIEKGEGDAVFGYYRSYRDTGNPIVNLHGKRTGSLIDYAPPGEMKDLLDACRRMGSRFPDAADTMPELIMNLRKALGAGFKALSAEQMGAMIEATLKETPDLCPKSIMRTMKAKVARGEFRHVPAMTFFRDSETGQLLSPVVERASAQAAETGWRDPTPQAQAENVVAPAPDVAPVGDNYAAVQKSRSPEIVKESSESAERSQEFSRSVPSSVASLIMEAAIAEPQTGRLSSAIAAERLRKHEGGRVGGAEAPKAASVPEQKVPAERAAEKKPDERHKAPGSIPSQAAAPKNASARERSAAPDALRPQPAPDAKQSSFPKPSRPAGALRRKGHRPASSVQEAAMLPAARRLRLESTAAQLVRRIAAALARRRERKDEAKKAVEKRERKETAEGKRGAHTDALTQKRPKAKKVKARGHDASKRSRKGREAEIPAKGGRKPEAAGRRKKKLPVELKAKSRKARKVVDPFDAQKRERRRAGALRRRVDPVERRREGKAGVRTLGRERMRVKAVIRPRGRSPVAKERLIQPKAGRRLPPSLGWGTVFKVRFPSLSHGLATSANVYNAYPAPRPRARRLR